MAMVLYYKLSMTWTAVSFSELRKKGCAKYIFFKLTYKTGNIKQHLMLLIDVMLTSCFVLTLYQFWGEVRW